MFDEEVQKPDDAIGELADGISRFVAGGMSIEGAAARIASYGPPRQLVDKARLEYEYRVGLIRTVRDPAAILSDQTRRNSWYSGPKPDDVFWPAVKTRLAASLPEPAIAAIHSSSSKVLAMMRAPGAVEFSTRGLVLGYVQSGKTTSFISVISKAADAGYRVFIVLSGLTENLRSQTQTRINDVLVGPDAPGWYRLTDLESDFRESTDNAANLLAAPNFRFIAVVKKNPARLRRLRDWLNAASPGVLAGAPILLIDDEADQASIDTGPVSRSTTINTLMQEILDRPKAAYVAYTATPFANLLINPSNAEDFYPRDFIVSLPEPDGYFGAERMFGRRDRASEDDTDIDGLNVIRTIPEHEAVSARPPRGVGAVHDWEPIVGSALGDAIRWFLVTTAARRVRGGGNKHATMLVHTSMLAEAHNRLAGSIEDELAMIEHDILSGGCEMARMRKLWEAESTSVPSQIFGHTPIVFDDFQEHLESTVNKARVIVDNYQSSDRLAYDEGNPATTIVVGGNTLSRGLTLEGLASSYFVRSASAYDTLLQMGRWFGYRHGYEELCRVWMTNELRGWFRDLSLVEAGIRQEMLRYEHENISPSEVAVRIRTHPDMAITAASKMRHATQAQMSYSGMRTQTILFEHANKSWLDENIAAVRALVRRASSEHRETRFGSGRRGFEGVRAPSVMKFLEDYNFHENAQSVRSDLLQTYIRKENEVGSLTEWNIAFIESAPQDGLPELGIELGLSSRVGLIQRSKLSNDAIDWANLKAITSVDDRVADLDFNHSQLVSRLGDQPNDLSLRELRESLRPRKGLICIYPIDMNSKPKPGTHDLREELKADQHLLGIGVFFPKAENAHSTVGYMSADLSKLIYESIEDESGQIDAADAADADPIDTVDS